MTIQEAIDELLTKKDSTTEKDSTTDDKVNKKLDDIIGDLERYKNSPERGGSFPIPDSVAKWIPKNSLLSSPMDITKAGHLQKAVTDMIYGKSAKSKILFAFTLIFTAIGLAVPLIYNKLDKDIWYFSIESAKDIIGLIFDGGGVVCATALTINTKKSKSKFNDIAFMVLLVLGILGIILTTLITFVHPIPKGKVYYLIFEMMFGVFATIGIIYFVNKSFQEPDKKSEEAK